MTRAEVITKCLQSCADWGLIPTEFKACMTWEEQVLWLQKFLCETIIPAFNANAEAIKEIQTWIETLDLQDEVDHKLDEMAASGELAEIISQYLNSTAIFAYDSVAAMKSAENLVAGSYAQTIGYYSANDGGDGLYKIRTKTLDDVVDDNKLVAIGDTLVGELIGQSNISTKLGVNLWLRNEDIDDVKARIDTYKYMGVTEIVLPIHLDGDGCTVSEDTDLVNAAIAYAKSKLININTVKFHCTNANLKTSAAYRELYKTNCIAFLNDIEGTTIERVIILNEMNSMFNSFATQDDADACAAMVTYFKSFGYEVSISVAGLEYFLDCYYSHPEVTNSFDFIAINDYPIIGDNKNLTSDEEVKEVYGEVYKLAQLIKSYYPTKDFIISEIGVQNVWESLSAPANYQIADLPGVTNSYGKVIPVFFSGLLNDNRMKEMFSEIWLWYAEYYSDYQKETKIFRDKFVGGNK